METRANYALIGAFVIIATMAVAVFTLWLGQSQFRQDFEAYDIVFEGPVSLEQGASVRYIGIKVGEVSWVRIDRGDPSKVRARIRVDSETPVKVDSTASIQLAGITGITFVQITAGTPNAASLRARPGQPVPVIKAERTQLDEIFAGGAEVLGKATRTIERVNLVLTDENIESLSKTLTNIERLSGQLAATDGTMAQATTTLRDVSAAAQRFEEASASFGSFSSNADAQITQFGGEANALIADLRNVTENANTAVEESNRAISAAADAIEGPATDALQDARLASRDLRVLIARLDRVARELEQNPQGFVVGDPAPYEESR
ncbi:MULTISPECIES: MlaD family protein [Hyphomonas]|uniref:MCE family protein n=1 Tax=Hyphomonas atlantica TaxID=1280948 RepID=A0A059E227_9PROT|nr:MULTISPECIES: MlaD family protein [Hyphomonas]OUX89867.1 MAG: MCE family protein [Hyphomonas sp. TMED31]KCZ61688.1 hypothetical protein HY36_03840 [Hyphomonas atlantica]MAH91778.1 MCE family protein [Hyphomonas sp.]HAE94344.1 MCE family protein [Hyphomonas atlantica]HBH44175.1 MCE family protein [Hyphomonas atlantica]|tara:strand:- start:404 stop:1363 length:960 start_codon:yes stop_codon:yes gene_type:complete